MRKLIIAALATVSLGAHAAQDVLVEGFWEKFVCMGAGTCYRDADGDLRKACTGNQGCGSVTVGTPNYNNYNTGTTIVTNNSTYVIVPKASGGPYPAAIIQSGK